MHHAGRNGEHSCVENFHGDDIYPHNINRHSCTYQSLPEHQVSKLCEYLTKRHIKSYQHMEGLNAFSNYVKTTLNLGSSLKEVDWGGNIDPKYTSSRCMLMEVDWEENSESTTYMNVCPVKVIGEPMKPIKMNTAPLEFIGMIMTQA